MSAQAPVFFRMMQGGEEVYMLVENLSLGGALLMAPGIYDPLQPGQRLPEGALVFADDSGPNVTVIVRWQFWPRIGVQFDGLSDHAGAQIRLLLESLPVSSKVPYF